MGYVHSEPNGFHRRKRFSDNDHDLIINSEDNRQYIVKDLLPVDFKTQTMEIARDIVTYYCTKPIEFEPAPSRTAKIMRNLVDDQLSDRQSFMKDLADRLSIESSKDLHLLDAVAEQMFCEEEITWSRVVTFHAFVSIIARDFLDKMSRRNTKSCDNNGEYIASGKMMRQTTHEGDSIRRQYVKNNSKEAKENSKLIDKRSSEIRDESDFHQNNQFEINNRASNKKDNVKGIDIRKKVEVRFISKNNDDQKDYVENDALKESSYLPTSQSTLGNECEIIKNISDEMVEEIPSRTSKKFVTVEEEWVFVENCWKTLSHIVIRRLGVWMATNGGWTSFDKQFPLVCIFDQSTLFKLILFVLILSASVVAFYFFINRSNI